MEIKEDYIDKGRISNINIKKVLNLYQNSKKSKKFKKNSKFCVVNRFFCECI